MRIKSVSSRRKQWMGGSIVALAALSVFAAFERNAAAALVTWTGGSGTNIDNAANWGGTAPIFGSGTQALLQTANNTATLNVPATLGPTSSVPALAFGANFSINGPSDLVLYGSNSGSTVVLRSNSGASAATINSPLKVFATSPASAPFGNLLTINVNNATANTNVTAVALNIANGISLASGSSATSYDIRFANGSGGFANARIGGTISGAGTFANAGSAWAGSLLISGNQASTSGTNISISSGSGFGNPTSTARLVLGEVVGDTQAWNAITLNNTMNLAIGGTITATSLAGSAASAKITGTGNTGAVLTLSSGTIGTNIAMGGAGTGETVFGLTKQGTGSLSIDGAKTYTGPTTVNGGTLSIASTGSLTSSITLNAGTTLSGEGSTSSSLTFGTGLSTLNFDVSTPTAAFTAGSVAASGSPIVIVTPVGTVTTGSSYTVLKSAGAVPALSTFALATRAGSLSYTGSDLIYTAAASAPASLVWKGDSGSNPTFWDTVNTVNWANGVNPDRFYAGDSLTFNDSAASFTVAAQGASQVAGDITFANASNAYSVTGTIGGTGTLTKTGAASVTLAGPVTRSGAITVSDGLLTLSSTTNTITGTGGIAVNNGGELRFAANPLATLGNQTVTLDGGAITYTGGSPQVNDVQAFVIVGNNSTIRVSSSPTVVWRIGGAITGSGNWTKSGASVLALGRNADTGPVNTFTGTVTVTAGVLDIRHPDSLGATTAGTTVQNAMLMVQNFGQTAGTRAYAEPLSFTGSSFLGNVNQQAPSYTTQFTGPITVGGTLGISTAITVISPGTTPATPPILEINGNTISTSSGSMIVLGRLGAYPYTLVSGNQTINVGSAIGGQGSISTDSNATAGSKFTLSANHSYTGTTTVNGGTLLMNGAYTGGGAFTVNAGTLGGTGSIVGDVTLVAAGATLSPGASIESLDVTGNVSLGSGTFLIEYNGSASPSIDLLTVSGSLNIQAATLSFVSLGSSLDPQQAYVFATYGSLTGSGFASILNLPSTHQLSYAYGGNAVALVPIPEPATLIGSLIVMGWVSLRRPTC
jgi:fibronectin-binding autotransporter adhesin